MLILASHNGGPGMQAAREALRGGGSALDAVEAGIRSVEANPEDHSVGYGGYPNILGQVEVDAALMDGDTLNSGAVAALQGYLHPISIARRVMEELPHVLLVGEGAARFARELGYPQHELLTDAAREEWAKRLRKNMSDEEFARLAELPDLRRWVKFACDPEHVKGTIDFIVQDENGSIAVGVSTSGWAWKYPGRVGDSPLVGAGLYADSRYGAAACTGTGEMAIRAATAHSVICHLRAGLSVEEAGRRAMAELRDLRGGYLSGMNVIVLDAAGNHAGFSSTPDGSYLCCDEEMAEPVSLPRIQVSLANHT